MGKCKVIYEWYFYRKGFICISYKKPLRGLNTEMNDTKIGTRYSGAHRSHFGNAKIPMDWSETQTIVQ